MPKGKTVAIYVKNIEDMNQTFTEMEEKGYMVLGMPTPARGEFGYLLLFKKDESESMVNDLMKKFGNMNPQQKKGY